MFQDGTMKIVNVNGSPHAEIGNTQALVKRFVKGLEESGFTIELVNHFLVKKNIEECRGCTRCMRKGACVMEKTDDVKAIADDLKSANLVVFSSPIYVLNVTGYMKKYIDRTAYMTHRLELEGKPGVYVLASQGLGVTETSDYMRRIMEAMGVDVVGGICGNAIIHGQFLDEEEIAEDIRKAISYLTDGNVKKEKVSSGEAERRDKFKMLMQKEDISKKLFGADYKYWKEREKRQNE